MTTEEMLEELVNLESSQFKLNDWELDFIDSMDRQMRKGESELSDSQRQKIREIHCMACVRRRRT